MSAPYVITIILNTNRRHDTLACLATLARSTYPNHKVIVLDNASSDGSVAAIRAGYPNVQILQLTENLGYAGNNNVGIQAALDQGADWVFVLNEDTLLDPDCLTRLMAEGVRQPHCGILGPMVYHYDEPEIIQSAGGKLGADWQAWHIAQNKLDLGHFTHPRPVDWISGCALLIRREVIEQIGMLDARFFYYWEETEWCLRASKAKWSVIHVPQAKLWHKGVQRQYQPSPNVTYYHTRNRFLLLSKHSASPQAWRSAWFEVARTLTSWTLKPQWRAMHEHRNAMWQGMLDFLRQRWGIRPA